MKKNQLVPTLARSALAAKAGQAVLEQLPVDRKKLARAAALLEPKNLKRLGVLAVSGTAALSLGASMLQTRLTRAALGRELKRQLAPMNKKLDELEAQNRELQKQNEELRRELSGRS